MNNFMQAIANNATPSHSTNFQDTANRIATSVQQMYEAFPNKNLNTLILEKTAGEESLNEDQLKRICEEVNNKVYLEKYRKMKNQKKRDISFELANPEAIMAAKAEQDAISKVASEIKISEDKYVRGISPEVKEDFTKPVMFELSKKAERIQEEYEKCASNFEDNIMSLSEMIIEYGVRGNDTRPALEEIYKNASVTYPLKAALRKVATARITNLKKSGDLPPNFKIDIPIGVTKEAGLSLGKYTLQKESMVKTASLAGQGAESRAISDMTKIASMALENYNNAYKANAEYNSLSEKLSQFSKRLGVM